MSMRAREGSPGQPHRVDRDALTVAMALVPRAYSRNRMFTLFKEPEVRRAKGRAAVLRGVVRQLAGSAGEPKDVVLERPHPFGPARLKYKIARVRYERSLELSALEAACLVYLGARAGIPGMHATADDRVLLHNALRRLTGGLALDYDLPR
jgi:hypothetical protein